MSRPIPIVRYSATESDHYRLMNEDEYCQLDRPTESYIQQVHADRKKQASPYNNKCMYVD